MPSAPSSATRVRSRNARDAADFELERALASTSAPTGSAVRTYRRVETPASIRSSTTRESGSRSAKCSYVASVTSPDPSAVRKCDRRHACPSGRQPRRAPPPTARPKHRAQPRPRAPAVPPSLPQQTRRAPLGRAPPGRPPPTSLARTGTFLSTAVPPSIFDGSPATLPTGTDGHGGTAASTKFYELRDNLALDLCLEIAELAESQGTQEELLKPRGRACESVSGRAYVRYGPASGGTQFARSWRLRHGHEYPRVGRSSFHATTKRARSRPGYDRDGTSYRRWQNRRRIATGGMACL